MVKYAPRKVYIRESGGYVELSYTEFCRCRESDQTYMDKLFIPIQGCLLEVVREQYTDFYRDKERWRYLQKLDTKNRLLSLDGFTDSEGNPLDFITDEAVDIAETVVNAVMVDRLKAALPLLSDSEQELIQAIFFDGLSEREVGARLGITQSVVNKRKARILIKLRKIIRRKENVFQILIVEDDKELSQLFQKVLEKNGYQVKSASDGAQALEVLDKEYIDLIISDIMMPVMDGYELVSELRSAGYQIPVLMITAKGSFYDMRQGFLSGSDDYMVKPVNVNEMVLRVGALLRRAQILNEHKIVIGSTEFDYDAMTVTTDKESLVLPKKEFLLLYKLAASPGRTFTKQQLMDEVWGYETEADPHTIEVHIGRIRERFKDNPDFEIVTMRGIGYKVVKK